MSAVGPYRDDDEDVVDFDDKDGVFRLQGSKHKAWIRCEDTVEVRE